MREDDTPYDRMGLGIVCDEAAVSDLVWCTSVVAERPAGHERRLEEAVAPLDQALGFRVVRWQQDQRTSARVSSGRMRSWLIRG